MYMDDHWILVASRDEARIFSISQDRTLNLVADIGNPTARLKLQDLESDRPGRASDNRMRARYPLRSEETSRERLLQNFYRDVFDLLEKKLLLHDFSRLTCIAEPRLLGILRSLYPSALVRISPEEIPKDLSFESPPKIMKYLSS
jgi:protein required for attachment to host cells